MFSRDMSLIADKLKVLPSFNENCVVYDVLDTSAFRVLSGSGIEIDFSGQALSNQQLSLLLKLAKSANLQQKIQDLFTGKKINVSQGQPALHTALRSLNSGELIIDGQNINGLVQETLNKLREYASHLRTYQTNPKTGHEITDIVNVGMGGSDLGARLALKALSGEITADFNYHFISDSDPDVLDMTLSTLNPIKTLFIICSKSFITKETLENMHEILSWSKDSDYANKNMLAVTANVGLAKQHGIGTCFTIWPWVCGRYSFFSAMNLLLMIAIGYEKFEAMLLGAQEMDAHVLLSPYDKNMAVMLGLVDILNINGRGANNRALLIYGSRLSEWLPYVQQLEMESNGKTINLQGNSLNYDTAPIVWGGMGNQAQHAYYQLLAEGAHLTPCDIITIKQKRNSRLNEHANRVMYTLRETHQSSSHSPDKIKNQVPFTHLSLESLSPFTLGALVSLFEHKTFVQSVIWDINPFDQPGVEMAKRVAAS
jgi:glucose-6-phosphate isomerase